MKKSNKKKVIMMFILLVLLLLIFSQLALARAGGGGSSMGSSSSSGGDGTGGIAALILLPFALLYSLIVTAKLNKKNQEARDLLVRVSKNDQSWELNKIKKDIESVYFKVQEAWMERDQTIARDFMSDRIFNKHKGQTDLMLEQHRKNILQNIRLIESRIVQVVDYKDDSRDMMWVYIKGSMIDYIINDETNKVLSGNSNKAEEFTELWKFVRGPQRWVLDEIDQTVTIEDFKKMQNYSEAN